MDKGRKAIAEAREKLGTTTLEYSGNFSKVPNFHRYGKIVLCNQHKMKPQRILDQKDPLIS